MTSNTVLIAGFLRRLGDLETVKKAIDLLLDFQPEEQAALRDSIATGRDLEGLLDMLGEPSLVLRILKIIVGCSRVELNDIRISITPAPAAPTSAPVAESSNGGREPEEAVTQSLSHLSMRPKSQARGADDRANQPRITPTDEREVAGPMSEDEWENHEAEAMPEIILGSPVSTEAEDEGDMDIDDNERQELMLDRAEAESDSGWFDDLGYNRNYRRPGLRPIPHQHQAYTPPKHEPSPTPAPEERPAGPIDRLIVEIPLYIPDPDPRPINRLLAEWLPQGPWDDRKMQQMTRVQFIASYADAYDWNQADEDVFMRRCAYASRRPVARIDRNMKPFRGTSALRLFCYYHGHLIRRLSPEYDRHIHLRTIELRHTIGAMIELPE